MKKIIKTFLSDAVVVLTLLFACYAEAPVATQLDHDARAVKEMRFVEENTDSDRADICAFVSECNLLAQTIAGEARSEPLLGKKLVASVVINRARERADSIHQVILAKNQFSFLEESIKEPTTEELSIAFGFWSGASTLPYDVNHYYSHCKLRKKDKPTWSKKKWFIIRVGCHSFYSITN